MLLFIALAVVALAFFTIGFVVGSAIQRKDFKDAQKEAMRQRKYFERMEARR